MKSRPEVISAKITNYHSFYGGSDDDEEILNIFE